MKHYNRLLAASVILYLVLAAASGWYLVRQRSGKDKLYLVEINRIYAKLNDEILTEPEDGLTGSMEYIRLPEPDLRKGAAHASWRYVKRVAFLPQSEAGSAAVSQFFQESNRLRSVFRPWFREGEAAGFLRFDFTEPERETARELVLLELSLAVQAVFLFGVLLYLRRHLIRPFQRMSGLPLELAKGHLSGAVTEEKSRYFGRFVWGLGQLKDNLETAKRRELELEKEKKQLLLSLSHDIKTPLSLIELYAKALEEGIYAQEGQRVRAAGRIREKAGEIEGFVAEIMRTSREDILDIRVEDGEFYLADLMGQVCSAFSERCAPRMVELTVGRYENRLLRGDKDRVFEVFENLLENALKYGDGRRIELSFQEEDYCQLIRVFSTGTPVTDNEFNHIFESFFRGGNSKGKSGSGLGLYICREILRRMDGEIFAVKEEEGMAFVVVLR